MPRLIITALALLILAASARVALADVYLPVIHKPPGDTIPPTNTPTATSTSTATSTATPTQTPTATATQPATGPCPCDADTLNCPDFDTQADAQACYDFCVSQGAGDIHRLDQDNNGIACESLPFGWGYIR